MTSHHLVVLGETEEGNIKPFADERMEYEASEETLFTPGHSFKRGYLLLTSEYTIVLK